MARQRFCWLFVDVVQWERLVAVVVGMPSRVGGFGSPPPDISYLFLTTSYIFLFLYGVKGVRECMEFDVLEPIDLVLFLCFCLLSLVETFDKLVSSNFPYIAPVGTNLIREC